MRHRKSLFGLAIVLAGLVSGPGLAMAHCDTMDGPVVVAAQKALQAGDVTPVLRWVQPADESAIKAAFGKTLAVRAKGDEARDLADQYFFETLVRIHRAGEGEPFTGLKPGGTAVEPGIAAADKAMESGSADAVVKMLAAEVEKGVRTRFAHAHDAAKHADHNVEAGRKAVAAYVQFMHYVEQVYATATSSAHAHDAGGPQPDAAPEHKHSKPGTAEH